MSDSSSRSLNTQLFPSGAVLIPEGGKLNTLFVLRSGELEVVRGGIVVTTIRQPGTIFGEMSVLLDAPHSATVRAVVPVEVFVIPDAVKVLEQRPQLLLQIARLLAKRVSNTTAALVAVEQQAIHEGTLVLPQDTVARLGDPRV